MYKQVFLYNGTPVLLEVIDGVADYPDEYTEIQPPDGLYQPISFDGTKWMGTSYEQWLADKPAEHFN